VDGALRDSGASVDGLTDGAGIGIAEVDGAVGLFDESIAINPAPEIGTGGGGHRFVFDDIAAGGVEDGHAGDAAGAAGPVVQFIADLEA